jgi:hypothetical protein
MTNIRYDRISVRTSQRRRHIIDRYEQPGRKKLNGFKQYIHNNNRRRE